MPTFKDLWRKLAASKTYRKEFVSTLLKRGTAMQIQALMKQKGWTQAQLAEHAGLTQGVISRVSNPDYGNLTFNTAIDIAAGFDVAFIGRFVPFSEFARWVRDMPEEMAFSMLSFNDENKLEQSAPTPKNVVWIDKPPDKPTSADNDKAVPSELKTAANEGAKKPAEHEKYSDELNRGLRNAASVGRS